MIVLNLIIRHILVCKNCKINMKIRKFEQLYNQDYVTVTLNLNYSEVENQNLINKYHQIYVDIYANINGEYAKEVEKWIAYSMTGDTFFDTNYRFNLGQSTANGKSTISHMCQNVLLIYWDENALNTFNYKNINNLKSLFKYQTARHLFCNEIYIYNINL